MKRVLILPGDGVGPEVIQEAVKVLDCLKLHCSLNIEINNALIGGVAYDQAEKPLPDETLSLAKSSDAILLGAVGGPKYDNLPRKLRPESGLLSIRSELDLFANLRPAFLFPQLSKASPLKEIIVSGLDILIVRELTSGIYFGQPRGIRREKGKEPEGFNTLVYKESEIQRIAETAFKIATKRDKKICSVDKANVLETSELWREVVTKMAQKYRDIEVSHMYVDNAAMQLVQNPKQFDVIVTSNMFGDILSDIAATLTGSIGMLPSASLNSLQKGIYEPIHGSAPDIAGKNIANPLACILSVSMMLRYSLALPDLAERVEKAVHTVLDAGLRTEDIYEEGMQKVTTSEMGNAVVEALA
jgi:3-isopropylmalate dehydrogenase